MQYSSEIYNYQLNLEVEKQEFCRSCKHLYWKIRKACLPQHFCPIDRSGSSLLMVRLRLVNCPGRSLSREPKPVQIGLGRGSKAGSGGWEVAASSKPGLKAEAAEKVWTWAASLSCLHGLRHHKKLQVVFFWPFLCQSSACRNSGHEDKVWYGGTVKGKSYFP